MPEVSNRCLQMDNVNRQNTASSSKTHAPTATSVGIIGNEWKSMLRLQYSVFRIEPLEYMNIVQACEGCSKFFHLENVIFAKKNSFAELSRTPCFSFAVHVGEDFEEKRGCVIISNCSRLHLNIYVLL